MKSPISWYRTKDTFTVLICGLCIVVGLQLFLAVRLDLYSDEIFYWQASSRPALAYSDLPFMSALLAGLGTQLLGNSAIAVRLPFIAMGAALPFLLYWVAKPIVQKQQAIESAALSLCVPLAAFAGLLAVPDVPLLFFGLLVIGTFERTLRSNQLIMWIALGLAAACGFSTHYRFFPYALAAMLYLLLSAKSRQCWKWPGFWLAVTLSLTGLIPVVVFNLSNDLSGLGYHLLDRHPWTFQLSGLLHIFKQSLLVTPPLYLVFLMTLLQMYRNAKAGDDRSLFFLAFAATNLATYLLLAPWADSTRTSIHWPLSGYFPLLIFVPQTLRRINQYLLGRFDHSLANILTGLIPALGFFGSLIAFIGIGSQAFQEQLQPMLGTGVLSNKMVGWKEFSRHTELILERNFSNEDPVIITDNYYTGAQIEFAELSKSVYTIDSDKAVRDGRIAQYAIWGRDASGLANATGKNALFISEDSTLTTPDKISVLAEMCSLTDSMQFIETLNLFNGEKRFSYYLTGVLREARNDEKAIPCPYPSQAWIDSPPPDASVSGVTEVSGWAFNEDVGIRNIAVLMNGKEIDAATYGYARPDVVEIMQVKSDPNSPNFGFALQFDSTAFQNGAHTLAILLSNNSGETQVYGSRRIVIRNP